MAKPISQIQNALLLIALWLIVNSSAFAQEIPVNIKADRLKYIEGTNLIEAEGSVEVKLKEITIYADSLVMDSESNVATAEGHVRMVTRDYRATADRLTYDAEHEVSFFRDFRSQLSTGRVKGELYLTAEEIKDDRRKMLGEAGELTTCGYEHPHYITVADRVEYYPEDKVVGYNVTLFVGGMPALWTPYMMYDLKEKRKRNWVFGHNQVEGDYVKSAWDYPYGILYLDLMEKKGFGYGTEVGYGLAALGAGTLFIYHLDEKDTGISDWMTRVSHTKNINSATTFKLDHRYTTTYLIPSGRKDQTSLGMSLGYADKASWNLRFNTLDDRIADLEKFSLQADQAYQRVATDYYFNYDFSKKDPKWIRAAQRFSHQRPLWSEDVMLSTSANYYNNVASAGAPGDERLEPVVNITGKQKNYSWRVTENWYIDLDRDTYTGDEAYQYLEKQPEVEIAVNPLDLRWFNLRPRFGYGQYHEVRYVAERSKNRDFSTQRYQGTLDLDQRIPLALGTVAMVGAGVDQFLYSPGDQRYAYREGLRLQTELFGFFRSDLDYKKGLADGNTPFFFDQVGSNYHNVTERLTFYHLDKFSWMIDGGHNWQTHKWFDVMTNLLLMPTSKLFWNVRTGWDIENIRYKDLVNSLKLVPYSFLSLEFSTVSDLNLGELKSGSVLYDMLFLEGEPNQWHVKVGQIFEPATRQFKVRDIMVVKDLHCWELRYTYSDYRKEFSLSFSLKALPDEPVGISSGRGFYIESFEKELKGIRSEGEVRRD
jgi:hypothetical protein